MCRSNLIQIAISVFVGVVFLIVPLVIAIELSNDPQFARKGQGGLAIYHMLTNPDA
ncbi:hypothetical protein [Oricola sp.]|uniref:hypothetical protein n=1 Tax=Oricola sp. TaxID=1979950 RepID=UPI003BAAAE32